MSADTSKMEEVINKPDDQFEDTLIDLCDYGKETSEKEALLKEIRLNETSNHHHIKPAASINSSTYSSAASSSSSSSSSSTNSASSTSSTLSSPSQSNLNATKASNDQDKDNPNKAICNELEEIEMAILEDQGRTATIVEHRSGDSTSRYLKNFVTAATPSFHFHDPRIQYRASMDNNKTRSTTNNLTSTKNLGSRKKRPVEQPVLSQHIPGHKGEQEVEWLVNFIESGASNQQTNGKKNNSGSNNNNNNNNNSTNKRVKSQPKKSNQLDSERDIQQPRKSSNVNSSSSSNINSNNSTSLANGKPNPSNHMRPTQTIRTKSMQNNYQAPLQSPAPQQQQLSQRKSQPSVAVNNQTKQSNQQVTNNNGKPTRPPPSSSSNTSRSYRESSASHSVKRPNDGSPSTTVEFCDDSQARAQSSKEKPHYAVTFADHIKISDDEETAQYSFGFFDEQKQKPKSMKTSLNSDQRRYMFNDNIDANSFNYKQILDFISKSWKKTIAVNMTKTAS